jgi:hypothetical protein
MDDLSDYGKRIGLANAILGVVLSAAAVLSIIAPSVWWGFILIPAGLVSLALFIIFWVRIAGHSREIGTSPRQQDHVENGNRSS